MDLPRDGPQHDSCFEQCRASCLGVHVHSLAPDNTNQRPPCHGVSVMSLVQSYFCVIFVCVA